MSGKLKRVLFAMGVICFIAVLLFSVNTNLDQVENNGLAGFVEIEETQEQIEEPFWSKQTPNATFEDSSAESNQMHFSTNLGLIHRNIEDAMGLIVASVRVTLEDFPLDEVFIPWRNRKQAIVRVTLPSTWLEKRISQIGNKDDVLDSLRTIIASVVPGSKISFHIVQVPPSTPLYVSTQESYAKHIVLLIGLFGILFASFIVDHRKSPREVYKGVKIENPTEEAQRILEMSYGEAIHAIDALSGPHKFNVLQSIVSCEVKPDDAPVVQIQKQTELVECN